MKATLISFSLLLISLNIYAQKPKDSCEIYITHKRVFNGLITANTGMDVHNDKFPVLFTFTENKQAFLVGRNFTKSRISYIKIVTDTAIMLQVKVIESPYSTEFLGKSTPKWTSFPSIDTAIFLNCNKQIQYFKTKRYKKSGKIYLELVPLSISRRIDRKLFKEIKKNNPVAEYNYVTERFILNKDWIFKD